MPSLTAYCSEGVSPKGRFLFLPFWFPLAIFAWLPADALGWRRALIVGAMASGNLLLSIVTVLEFSLTQEFVMRGIGVAFSWHPSRSCGISAARHGRRSR